MDDRRGVHSQANAERASAHGRERAMEALRAQRPEEAIDANIRWPDSREAYCYVRSRMRASIETLGNWSSATLLSSTRA